MQRRARYLLIALYVLATVHFVWCYLWIARPYVDMTLYEKGLAHMPFQGRVLMMLPLRLAHNSTVLQHLVRPFAEPHFWFPRPVQPEAPVQTLIYIASVLIAGYVTTRIYMASSRDRLLTPWIYPLFLAACTVTYLLHTVQNYRFVYDLPSLAFFSGAMYLLYFRKPIIWFVLLFIVATMNRETTLLLLPLFLLNEGAQGGRWQLRRALTARSVVVVLTLSIFWVAWSLAMRRIFAHNDSEFYPRFDWNIKALLLPYEWPQLLSPCGYLLLCVAVLRRRLHDPQLRAWLWILPIWVAFMFVWGILIETRIYGELIPFVVCSAALIFEQTLLTRMRRPGRTAADDLTDLSSATPRSSHLQALSI